jgi:hypothetical protein
VPLKSGKSNKVVSANVQTLVDDWQAKGRIGTSRPKTKKQAVKQAVAIALSKAGRKRKPK